MNFQGKKIIGSTFIQNSDSVFLLQDAENSKIEFKNNYILRIIKL